MSRLKTLTKTTAMTFTAAAVLATSAGLAANAQDEKTKGDALEEVGQGYHLQIDDDLVWFGGLKNPDGYDPLIWSTRFTNKIPYNSQGYFLNTTNVDNHQDPQGSAEALVDSEVYAARVTVSFIMASNSMGVSFPSRR